VIFFYEMLFVAVALAAVYIGERWNHTVALLFLLAWWALIWVGYASFGARLAAAQSGAAPLGEDDLRWYRDARDGLRHMRLLFGLACGVMLLWRLAAGA
jgi:hypothetical protein